MYMELEVCNGKQKYVQGIKSLLQELDSVTGNVSIQIHMLHLVIRFKENYIDSW
jgi:hypothetical protein